VCRQLDPVDPCVEQLGEQVPGYGING